MANRLFVRSFPAPGFDSVGRGGHRWPADGTEIETVDTDEDQPPQKGGPIRIGKVTLAALEGDPRIAVSSVGGVGKGGALEPENQRLRERVAELERQLAESDASLAGAAPDIKAKGDDAFGSHSKKSR